MKKDSRRAKKKKKTKKIEREKFHIFGPEALVDGRICEILIVMMMLGKNGGNGVGKKPVDCEILTTIHGGWLGWFVGRKDGDNPPK